MQTHLASHGIRSFAALLLAAAATGARAQGSVSHDDGIGTARFATEGGATLLRTARTIPYFQDSFTYQGTTYPFTMVGTDPVSSDTRTVVPTALIPIRFVFADGQVLDGSSKVAQTLASPIFQAARFSSGNTQFGDAIQRATFWSSVESTGWHVLLGAPAIYPTVTINVPQNQAQDFVGRISGKLLGLMSASWFSSQFQNVINQLHIAPTVVPIAATYNIFLYVHDPSDCCILGYHGARSSVNGNGNQQVQTYIFASWTDPKIFSAPGIQDIHALSHEVSEWLNDPFIQNVVPPWSTPSAPQYGCTGLLETGDPLVGYAFPVKLNGFTYHPQTEALLPWFAREVPSTAIDGAYSYPDETALTSPATGCQ